MMTGDINWGLAPASCLAIFFPHNPEIFKKMHCKLQIIGKKLIKGGINTIYYDVFGMMSRKQYKQTVNWKMKIEYHPHSTCR